MYTQKTFHLKANDVDKKWHLIDADGLTVGRLATELANILRGKNKPTFTPHIDSGDYVVVINAEKVKVTGNKESDKMYWRHSGYPGGLTEYNFASLREKHPDRLISKAVKGMLPSNKLGSKLLGHLKVYRGADHPHIAQNPQKLELK